MKTIEFYILQVLFFAIYLPLVTLFAHFALSAISTQNTVVHAVVYFSLYSMVCVYNTRKFPLIDRRGKYLIILIPSLISTACLTFLLLRN